MLSLQFDKCALDVATGPCFANTPRTRVGKFRICVFLPVRILFCPFSTGAQAALLPKLRGHRCLRRRGHPLFHLVRWLHLVRPQRRRLDPLGGPNPFATARGVFDLWGSDFGHRSCLHAGGLCRAESGPQLVLFGVWRIGECCVYASCSRLVVSWTGFEQVLSPWEFLYWLHVERTYPFTHV